MTSEQFKAARLSCGLTQVEMAELMGVVQSAIARIESGGRQPTKQHAATVALIVKLYNIVQSNIDRVDLR
jgi:transcriptional regulator with XRE-family HTH domain